MQTSRLNVIPVNLAQEITNFSAHENHLDVKPQRVSPASGVSHSVIVGLGDADVAGS